MYIIIRRAMPNGQRQEIMLRVSFEKLVPNDLALEDRDQLLFDTEMRVNARGDIRMHILS